MIVTCPGRNFVTLKIETDEGLHGLGDATLNGRELAVASYLDDHVDPLPDRPRPAPDRGHLAVPLPRRLLAARAGDDERRSPRSTWRCGTSRPRWPGCRSTSCSAARAATGVMVYGHANGRDIEETVDAVAALHRAGLQGDPRAVRRARAWTRSTASAAARASTSRPRRACRARPSGRPRSTCDHVPKLFERAARDASASSIHLLHDVHHRLTPIEAARLGKELEPYRLFWMEDADAGREPGGVPPDPPAHHHAAGGRRDLQLDLGLQGPDREPADRLHPRHRRPCRRHHAPAPHRRTSPSSTRCAPAATARPTCRRCAWARRCTSTSGCRTSASRNTCATRPRPTRSSRTPTRFDDGFLFRRGARSRRRHRRGAGGEVPVRARLPAGRAARGRDAVELVSSPATSARSSGPLAGRRRPEPGHPSAPVGWADDRLVRTEAQCAAVHLHPYIPHGRPKCSRARPEAKLSCWDDEWPRYIATSLK